MLREKKTCHFGPPNCLEDMPIMYGKSQVSGLSACIPSQEGMIDNTPIGRQEEDQSEEDKEEEVTPSSSTSKNLKRKGKSPKKTPFKKGKKPMVKVMSHMVDDVISANSVTSKALTDDFTHDSTREVMALVKDAGAKEGSNEHYIATQLFKNAANREIFLPSETNEGRFNWLKRCYEEGKK
jgi:hypothetical protein